MMGELRWTAPGVGENLIDILLSMSRQSVALYDDKTALASYSAVEPTLETLDDIADALARVEGEIAGLQDHPGDYMRGILRALRCTLRVMQGDRIPYAERLREIQQLTLEPIPEQNFARLEEKVSRQLADLGYKGSAPERIKAYLEDTRIPPEQVASTARKMIDAMRKATLRQVVTLPEDEAVSEVNGVTGVFWSGFSKYDGGNKGTLSFNIERPWSTPTFANVLSHEAYPGHQTFYCLWDVLYLSGKLPLEAAYYMINTPTNALFEGAPENGLAFLDWLDPRADAPERDGELIPHYALGRDILDLQRLVQTQSCYLYHIQGVSADEATAFMTGTGLMQEIEARNTVRFYTHPVQCTYYPSYYYGRHLVSRAMEAYGRARRDQFFKELYTVPHTNETFVRAVSRDTGREFTPFAGL